MLDFQIQQLRETQFKSQLTPAMQQEFILRFGREAYNALPDHPTGPRVNPSLAARPTPI